MNKQLLAATIISIALSGCDSSPTAPQIRQGGQTPQKTDTTKTRLDTTPVKRDTTKRDTPVVVTPAQGLLSFGRGDWRILDSLRMDTVTAYLLSFADTRTYGYALVGASGSGCYTEGVTTKDVSYLIAQSTPEHSGGNMWSLWIILKTRAEIKVQASCNGGVQKMRF